MGSDFPLFPEQASTMAEPVDRLFFFILGVCLFFGTLIFGLVAFFAVRYRRRAPDEVAPRVALNRRLEYLWMAVPLGFTLVMFVWGADLSHRGGRPPPGAIDVYVVGKQWMWKVQHPDGRREINELHVPVGRPVRVILSSEDVVHSFYIPAFRVKMDAVPGRTTEMWFEPVRTGTYHLFCAEYCGTLHSGMVGRIVVLEARAYERWLAGGAGAESMASAGERLYVRLGCASCHAEGPSARGPLLEGLFGTKVRLADGREAVADERYLRESILEPAAKLTAGYPPIMPAYKGQLGEEEILQLVDFLKSRGRKAP